MQRVADVTSTVYVYAVVVNFSVQTSIGNHDFTKVKPNGVYY